MKKFLMAVAVIAGLGVAETFSQGPNPFYEARFDVITRGENRDGQIEDLLATDDGTIADDLTVGGDLVVSGAQSAVSFTTTGHVGLGNNSTDTVAVAGILAVSNDVNVVDDLTVGDDTTLGSDLSVTSSTAAVSISGAASAFTAAGKVVLGNGGNTTYLSNSAVYVGVPLSAIGTNTAVLANVWPTYILTDGAGAVASNVIALANPVGGPGQQLTVIARTTNIMQFNEGGNLNMAGDFTMGNADVITFIAGSATNWDEVSRSNN